MDNWTTFPDLFEQFLTDQQPPAYPFGHPLSHELDGGNELASHDSISAQQATNLFEPLNPLSLSQEHLVPVPQNTGIVSTNDAELTAASMGPPPKRRKKKAPTLRAKDWEPYKARILELHDAQKLPLAKVKEIIEEEFGFSAEPRQYRTRITQWGKDKNIKPAEMSAIVRKRQQRKLVEVNKREQIFSVRGRNVETHKIDRWMTRNGVSQTSLYAPSPAASTPSAILCRTISECGSEAPSPAYSIKSLSFSPGSTISTTSPMITSPVTLMPGIGYPQSSGFNIQSHTHAYQTVSTMPMVRQPPASDAIYLDQPPRRYRQDEEEAARKALSVAESSPRSRWHQIPLLRIQLGNIVFAQGRYRHAEVIARRAMEDCDHYGISLTVKLEAFKLLSTIMYFQGSCHQAQKLQKWMFELKKIYLGEKHPSTVRSMVGLSWVYFKNGSLGDAEDLCAQALEISKEASGEMHLETMRATTVLVDTYTKQGRLYEAERLGLQSLTNAVTISGDGHIGTIDCMLRLAVVYHKQGRSNEAGELLRQALKMSVHSLGKDHPLTINIQHNLSAQYKLQGRLEEAQDLEEQALAAARGVFGERHPQALFPVSLLIEI